MYKKINDIYKICFLENFEWDLVKETHSPIECFESYNSVEKLETFLLPPVDCNIPSEKNEEASLLTKKEIGVENIYLLIGVLYKIGKLEIWKNSLKQNELLFSFSKN